MRPTNDATQILSAELVEEVVHLIRRDAILGTGTCSSWEEVTPSDFEAAERVRDLLEDGVVTVEGPLTARRILRALREAEPEFWRVNR